MKVGMKALLLFLLLVPGVLAAPCEDAYDLMRITKDTVLCNKAYDVQNGISIAADGVTLDCNGAIIRGTGLQDGQGIILDKVSGVTVKNCNILNFDVGIYVKESHRNTIIQNALLKNKVGVRMLQAFENRFESNVDKSLLKPVSAIASKFNSFWLTNKDLDRDFCAVNLCNQPGPMDPCANGDFYCSPNCAPENDDDCPKPLPELLPVTAYPALADEPQPALAKTELPAPAEETPSLATGATVRPFFDRLSAKARFWTMATLFVLSYLIGFLIFQHHHWKHRRN